MVIMPAMQLPEQFIIRTKDIIQAELQSFIQALDTEPPVSIRVNDKAPIVPSAKQVPWCDTGYYLPERPLFTADPFFHAGAYYVQEASSMFLCQALEQTVSKDDIVLDLSAAPGGKSTLIAQYLGNNGFLVSNEISRNRAFILTENMIKWGNDNVLISNNAPKDFCLLPDFFDTVVVDAPCSGEGMFRKDAGAIDEWSPENVAMCAARQKSILADVWDSLKTDGILIYSTCTYNFEENEDNVKWIEDELGAEFVRLDIQKFPKITTYGKGYRFYPHKTEGEGFFLAVLKKTSGASSVKKHKKYKEYKQTSKIGTEVFSLKNYLQQPESWDLVQDKNMISAVKKTHLEKVDILKNNLRPMHFGITLAEQKGKDFIPHISLALSKNIELKKINTAEIDKTTALKYLRRESVFLPDAAKGFVLLTYKNIPIGWVKNLGNRSNNLYPNEWRIRMKLE